MVSFDSSFYTVLLQMTSSLTAEMSQDKVLLVKLQLEEIMRDLETLDPGT